MRVLHQVFICKECGKEVHRKIKKTFIFNLVSGENLNKCDKCQKSFTKKFMRKHDAILLYIDSNNNVSDGTSTVQFKPLEVRYSKTNMFHVNRIDVWFYFDNSVWWGRHQGFNNTVVRCKRTKNKLSNYGIYKKVK